jgi:23S rRNA pseudouridine1911/1915/1917 synthase
MTSGRSFAGTVADGLLADRLDKRLLEVVRDAGEQVSRASIQRAIHGGLARVDGRVVRDPSFSVRPGSRLEVAVSAPAPLRARADARVDVRVVYQDPYLLVVDKPAGMVVHPAKGHAGGTLVNGLLALDVFGQSSARASDTDDLRPGIVHRLDKGTSGLLVVAKDERTQAALKELFSRHDIVREYVAIVVGDAQSATIDTLHGRHPTDRKRFTSRPRGPGKRAVTHVEVLERLPGATLVRCTLETGRTHQIRVHLSEQLRTPILGDPLYGSRPRDPKLADIARRLGHQALHARVLGFVHPRSHKALRRESPLPQDFQDALDEIRSS